MRYDASVFVGRFQPFHKGHLHNIEKALEISEKMILIIGSAQRARTIKNPFTFDERKSMILSDLKSSGIDINRVFIEPVVDYFYNEQSWVDDIRQSVKRHVKPGDLISIVGHDKDSSSYYLKIFPTWDFVPVSNYAGLNATCLRNDLWQLKFHKINTYLVQNKDSNGSNEFLNQFVLGDVFSNLVREYEYVSHYKKSWRKSPFDPIFVTVDSLVIYKDEILLIQRKNRPGKGLWALPGGFLDKDERINSAMVRELNEETNIQISDKELLQSLIKTKVFDYPDRSTRGRAITHVGLFDLSNCQAKPDIKAADDAELAKWYAFSEFQLMSAQMMDDHFQIINDLVGTSY